MKIASAKLAPWSSIVGQSITLHDESGKVVAQLAVIGAGSREVSENVAEQVVGVFDEMNRHRAVTENLHILSTSNKR